MDVFIRIQLLTKKTFSRGVFDDVAEMFKHVWRQRAKDMTNAFYQHIKVRLTRYIGEDW